MEWQDPTECSMCGCSDIAATWYKPEAFARVRSITVEWQELWSCHECGKIFAERKRRFELDEQMVNQTKDHSHE